MSNWGRIAVDFWRHPKTENVSDAAIGVWTRANSWSRDKRTSGFISLEQAGNYDPVSVKELVDSQLWDQVDNGYLFHDFHQHNGDVNSHVGATKMVYDILGGTFPEAVIKNLASRVEELLQEGQSHAVLKEAIKVWGETPNANVALLPYLVADLVRKNAKSDVLNVIRDAWRTNNVHPLRAFGHWFEMPSIPREITDPEEATAYVVKAQREWLKELAEKVGSK